MATCVTCNRRNLAVTDGESKVRHYFRIAEYKRNTTGDKSALASLEKAKDALARSKRYLKDHLDEEH